MYSLTLAERFVLSNLFAIDVLFFVSLVVCFILTNLFCSAFHMPHINSDLGILNTSYIFEHVLASLIAATLILLLIIQFAFGNPEDKEKRMIVTGEVVFSSNSGGLNLVSRVIAHSKNTKVIVILNSRDEIELARKVLKDTPLYNVLESFLIFDKEMSRRDNLVVLSQESNINFLEHCKVLVLLGEDKELSEHLETYDVNSEAATGRELYLKLHSMRANRGPFKFDKITLDRPRSTEGSKCGVATIDGTVVRKKGEKHENT